MKTAQQIKLTNLQAVYFGAEGRVRLCLAMLAVLAAVGLAGGCVCVDGVTQARSAALRVEPRAAVAGVRIGVAANEQALTPDAGGVYRFEIPSMPWGENVWLGFIQVPAGAGDAKPFLRVSKTDGGSVQLSARQLERLPVDRDRVSVLKLK
jgi:hypothetical protein